MATTAVVNVDVTGAKINRHLYGQFAEHLGNCIYEGIFVGEDSPIPNVRGMRTDVVEASVNKPVVVDFWAEWCGPCKKLSPMLDEIACELGDEAEIVKVNVDEERTLGGMFQIMSIPTVLIFRNGEKVDEFVGLQPKNTIVAKIQKAV